MLRFAKTVGGTVMGLTLTLLVSPTAHADDASFVRDTQALGFLQSPVNLISTGRSACYFLDRRRDPDQIVNRIERYTRVDSALAQQFLALAVNEYCPQYR